MSAALEIYNQDGSLRYSSARFRALRWEGGIKIPMTVHVVTNSNNTSSWYLNVTLHFSNISHKGLLFLPQFRKTWALPIAAGDQTISGMYKNYPTSVSKAYMLEDIQKNGYLLRY